MSDLSDLSVSELLASFKRREATPLEAVTSCLDRIGRLDKQINAVLTLCADDAIAEATEAGKRWQNRQAKALDGVPFGVKDTIMTAGIRTTGGSKIYSRLIPKRTAHVVQYVQSRGAILLAKLQTFEFAIGDNSHYGPTRNPWNLAHTTGGSSSGSAASVAAHEVPLAIGTDTGGSVRVPATLCGVCGLKPTPGLISRNGVMPMSWTLDTIGPLTRTVEDISIALNAMVGFDPEDPTSVPRQNTDYLKKVGTSISGIRIGIPTNYFFEIVDHEVAVATRQAIECFKSEGARLLDVRIPHADLAGIVCSTIMHAEHASLQQPTLKRIRDYSEPLSQEVLASAQFISASDYLKALRARHLLQRDFEELFERVDAIVVPGMIGPAPRLKDMTFSVGGKRYAWSKGVGRLTAVFSVVGLPTLAIPSGLHTSGLPMGIQIAARPFSEDICLRLGKFFQRATNHHLMTPPAVETAASRRSTDS